MGLFEVIGAAYRLVQSHPETAALAQVVVSAYMETLTSLLDDYELLQAAP